MDNAGDLAGELLPDGVDQQHGPVAEDDLAVAVRPGGEMERGAGEAFGDAVGDEFAVLAESNMSVTCGWRGSRGATPRPPRAPAGRRGPACLAPASWRRSQSAGRSCSPWRRSDRGCRWPAPDAGTASDVAGGLPPNRRPTTSAPGSPSPRCCHPESLAFLRWISKPSSGIRFPPGRCRCSLWRLIVISHHAPAGLGTLPALRGAGGRMARCRQPERRKTG